MAVAVVAILIAMAAGSLLMMGGNEDEKSSKGSGRLLIYGNADNDDYLDHDDVDKINEIITSGKWDKESNPFADANNDGKVDHDDVAYLERILNGEKTTVYYIGSHGSTVSFNYPAGDKKIAVSSDYGMMMAQILGVYDRIVAGAEDRVLTKSESRYPGCSSWESLGNYTSGSYDAFVENFLDSGCKILMGQVTQSVYQMIRDSGADADLILLSPSAEIQENGIGCVESILTCGVLLDKGDKAREYVNYFDTMSEYVTSSVSDLNEKSYLLIYNPSNATTCTIHTNGDNGSTKGDAWPMSYLPLHTDFKWNGSAANGKSNGVEIETVITMDPDVIIFSIWNKAEDDTDPAKVQAIVDEMALWYKETTAYKTGNIYAVNYESYGTFLGIGGLALLASYIWPDSFSEETGWELLQEAVDKFTLIDADVKSLGGIIPYKVNTTA